MADGRKNKKEIIIEVARESFAYFGYKRTVIDDIVRKAGIAKGTFYLYFKNKEELFLQVVATIRGEMLEEWQKAISGLTSPAEKIRASLRFSLEALEKHPLFAKLTNRDEEFRLALRLIDDAQIQNELEQTLLFFRSLFEEGIAQGELRPDLDLDVIPTVLGSLKFMHFFKEEIKALKLSEEQFIDGLLDLAMNGILKK